MSLTYIIFQPEHKSSTRSGLEEHILDDDLLIEAVATLRYGHTVPLQSYCLPPHGFSPQTVTEALILVGTCCHCFLFLRSC